eukprot:Skav226565  [mRNA]  locus=scaffold1701:76443:77102:- [translate_table: standard]
MAAKHVAAWKCIEAAPYYKAISTAEKDESRACAVGDTFFGELSENGLICNESNGLYVPSTSCEELTWTCVESNGVSWRLSPELSDRSWTQVPFGARISAMPVQRGWLQEATTKRYLPIHHPSTGEALFTEVIPQVEMSTASWEQQPLVVSKPPTVPSGSNLIFEHFNGNLTCILGCLACCCCFPCGVDVCSWELDQRQCWLAPDGRKFDLGGTPIVVLE